MVLAEQSRIRAISKGENFAAVVDEGSPLPFQVHLAERWIDLRLSLGPKGAPAPRCGCSEQIRFGHLPLIKSQGRETSGDQIRKEIISGRLTPGRLRLMS